MVRHIATSRRPEYRPSRVANLKRKNVALCSLGFSVLRQPAQIRAFFRYRRGVFRKAYLRRCAVNLLADCGFPTIQATLLNVHVSGDKHERPY
jgi:hypothetical protein